MIVIMAGLPATGKSTLARLMAAQLNGVVIDKDEVRAVMFPSCVDYTIEQANLAMECVFAAVRYMVRAYPDRPVFIDGRPFALKVHVDRALEVIQQTGSAWRIIEAVCSDETARVRLEASANHVATNRTFQLYCSLKTQFEPISEPKHILNTERPMEECVREGLDYIALIP